MIAIKVGTEDILNIGAFGKLKATLPDFAAVESTKNLVSRVKARHPRPDGLTFTTIVEKTTNTITVSVVKPGDENPRGRRKEKP